MENKVAKVVKVCKSIIICTNTKMVSTRGLKFRFQEGEKVLCYEPDPTKAKVLYDSKVLQVLLSKDRRGRKVIEYMIHFQGWNSSWDRSVREDYVLKDTDENRQLQQHLAEKAQVQLWGSRERKKRKRKPSDESVDKRGRSDSERSGSHHGDSDGGPSADERVESDGEEEEEEVVEEEEVEEMEEEKEEELYEERVPLELSDSMKKLLEEDFERITHNNMLVSLPASPNVVTILEGYLKFYATNQLYCTPAKNNKVQFHSNKNLQSTKSNIGFCKEIVDGLRVMFDFTIGEVLLYKQEYQQFQLSKTLKPVQVKKEVLFPPAEQTPASMARPRSGRNASSNGHCKEDGEETNFPTRKQTRCKSEDVKVRRESGVSSEQGDVRVRRVLRSHQPAAAPEAAEVQEPRETRSGRPLSKSPKAGTAPKHDPPPPSSAASTSSECSSVQPSTARPTSVVSAVCTQKPVTFADLLSWHLVPEHLYNEQPALPSLVYGAVHLARLFVKLPELLYSMNMPDRKTKLVLSHLNLFLEYLEEHTAWFSESSYTSAPPTAD